MYISVRWVVKFLNQVCTLKYILLSILEAPPVHVFNKGYTLFLKIVPKYL